MWQMPVQLQYIKLIMDKTNVADMSSGVFAKELVLSRWNIIKLIAIPQICLKTGKQWCNKGNTELYCLFIAADSIDNAISFIRCIVLWFENSFSPNPVPALAPAGLNS